MIGAIIGDIAGSRFEFKNTSDYNFQIFHPDCSFTDDTICTVAVADAILRGVSYKDSLLHWCRKYPSPMGAYGGSFSRWIHSQDPQPYYSFGNGAAMRVSPVAWAFQNEATVLREAIKTAECTHNHPEGLIGAMSVAEAIFRIRTSSTPGGAILNDVFRHYYGCDIQKYKIHNLGKFDVTCQGCVPIAFTIVMTADSFEDAIRRAISVGGDSDTLGAIVGSLAEARFKIPIEMAKAALNYLPEEMREIVNIFHFKFQHYYEER
ncbi:MAG: ADP-ribosylglycohydrolase family protein [Muribaculaceae bacterium]